MIDRDRLATLRSDEESRFVDLHPRSAALAAEARGPLLAGVPMPWMTRWAGSFPLTFDTATGARLTDVDGIEYVDLCLGDTGAMTGHALPQVADAIAERARTGITTMLPSTDATWAAEELARRFRVPSWQFAISATDANRFVLRFARHLTGRPRIAVFDWCYHGTVDETFAVLEDGQVIPRPGSMGPQVDPAETTAVLPFNDVDALDKRLAEGDVACLLMEPALTNIGIVLPEEGYLDAVREITRRHGVLLIIDETHTLCAGPGGCTAAWDLEPDFVVVGKAIGGGVPAAAYGMSRGGRRPRWPSPWRGPRSTSPGSEARSPPTPCRWPPSGPPCRRACGRRTSTSPSRWPSGSPRVSRASSTSTTCPGTSSASAAARSTGSARLRATAPPPPPPSTRTWRRFLHLWALNRGILLTPFHNMALFSPHHSEADVDRHTEVFGAAIDALPA